MQYSIIFALALAVSRSASAPTPQDHAHSSDTAEHHDHASAAWDEGAVHEWQLHESCNASEQIQLRKGLQDAVTLAEHAKAHILRYSNGSAHYQKYFGSGASGQVLGWYDKIVNGDRGNALFRCDNPDGNCALEDYGGHWRGENATNETVICPLSYETRRPLEQLCALGYTVAGNETNTYFGSDLLHRLYHIPAFGDHFVEHYTEDYAEVLEIAQNNATYAIRDSDVLQYFALEVYAYDIVLPGVGCPGETPTHEEDETMTTDTGSLSASATPEPTATDTASPSGSAYPEPSETADAPTSAEAASDDSATPTMDVPPGCHTHEGGELHCD